MRISGHALNAADHTRESGEICVFAICPLDRKETGPVGEPMMSLSVVTTRLSMRSPNCEFTANK